MNKVQKILITGATGHLGPHVLSEIKKIECSIRVATPDPVEESASVEWVKTDFLQHTDYDSLVAGVSIVIHLAAELKVIDRMQFVNVEVTSFLAAAAARAGVARFIYTSTSGAYGFPAVEVIDEKTPTLDSEEAAKIPYLADDIMRIYSLTKLKGEYELAKHAAGMKCIIFRPTNIINDKQIQIILGWRFGTFLWRSNRFTHQIHADDVASAISFAVLSDSCLDAAQTAVYILSDDAIEGRRFLDFFRLVSGKRKLWVWIASVFRNPLFLDRLKDRIKFKRWNVGYPPGHVIYSPEKLYATGYRHPVGIVTAQKRAIVEYRF
jgi:nucleoside-diphosphate-sugar epimerase